MENNYREPTLAGATGVELIVALYDAMVRFLYRAMQAVEDGDVRERRVAVKKVVDIIIYLQSRLRPDVGGEAAAALSNFYSAMFTLTLEASHFASPEKFQEVIACVRNVRDAWVIASRDPVAGRVLPRELKTREERFLPGIAAAATKGGGGVSRWEA